MTQNGNASIDEPSEYETDAQRNYTRDAIKWGQMAETNFWVDHNAISPTDNIVHDLIFLVSEI